MESYLKDGNGNLLQHQITQPFLCVKMGLLEFIWLYKCVEYSSVYSVSN